ncbi:MAG TPA: medium chain dehydrogenase/reductase family protein [Verrucomicrobiae bacterium]|nr:medium chain dehydrogenase/reductase family protein [Verrucomicrobiae bacterium]
MPAVKNGRIVVTALGGPEVLKYIEEDLPEPGRSEVRVKVLAAGVGYADVLMRRGLYPGTPPFPFTPGYDLVGEVDALGKDVTQFAVGQRVGALTIRGAYSQFAIVPEDLLVPVPESLEPSEAVCLILNYVTAYQMLHRVANISSGQRILIHGAAGGVGTALLQLGALHGLTMYGTASKSKQDAIAAAGGIPIDYRAENFSKRVRELSRDGVDAVFDAIGGTNWWRSYRLVRRGGVLVCYGVSAAVTHGKIAGAGSFLLMGVLKLIPDGRRCVWFNVANLRKERPEWFRADLKTLFDLLLQRKIQPVIASRLPLREAAQANELIEHAKFSGKIVLLCQE